MKYLVRVIIVAILFTGLFSAPGTIAEAATMDISKTEFIRDLVTELKLDISDTSSDPYILAALKAGILKEEDFDKNYFGYITRTDAAVLLNRADEYLHGDTVDAGLLDIVLNNRISDINKVPQEKRDAVAKCFVKGMIKGYSNGDYTQDRAFRGSEYLTMATSKAYIKLVKNKSKRAKLSPDGQLIRTTNLPKNSKLFPYILASFPNKYYEWQLIYQRATMYDEDGELHKMRNLVDYASPADIDKLNVNTYKDFGAIRKEKIGEWVAKAKKHLQLVFSADYLTVGDEWINEMKKINYQYKTDDENFCKTKLDEYIERMRENRSVVEYKKIAVDGSSLYYFDDAFYMRVYVKYRIKSSVAKAAKNVDEFLSKRPYDKILYSNGPVKIDGFELNKWKDGYYDIKIIDYNDDGNLGVSSIWFDYGKELD